MINTNNLTSITAFVNENDYSLTFNYKKDSNEFVKQEIRLNEVDGLNHKSLKATSPVYSSNTNDRKITTKRVKALNSIREDAMTYASGILVSNDQTNSVTADMAIFKDQVFVIVRFDEGKRYETVKHIAFERLDMSRDKTRRFYKASKFCNPEYAQKAKLKVCDAIANATLTKKVEMLYDEVMNSNDKFAQKKFASYAEKVKATHVYTDALSVMLDEYIAEGTQAIAETGEGTEVAEEVVFQSPSEIGEGTEEVVEVQEGTEREFIDTSDYTSVSTRDLFTDKVIETISNHYKISEYTTREALNAIHNKVSIKRNNAPFVYFMKNKINNTKFADHKSIYTYINLLLREYTDWSLQYRF